MNGRLADSPKNLSTPLVRAPDKESAVSQFRPSWPDLPGNQQPLFSTHFFVLCSIYDFVIAVAKGTLLGQAQFADQCRSFHLHHLLHLLLPLLLSHLALSDRILFKLLTELLNSSLYQQVTCPVMISNLQECFEFLPLAAFNQFNAFMLIFCFSVWDEGKFFSKV